MFWILLFLLLIGLILFHIMKNKNQGISNTYSSKMRSNQVSLAEQHGTNILHYINNNTSSNNQPQPSSSCSNAWEQRTISPKAKSLLHPDLASLRDRVLAIMVGTYHLDETTISYLRINMDYVLTYLLQTKLKSGQNIENAVSAILEAYNPTSNNDLVLEACRDLMHYQLISDSKRILIAQYIVNRTNNGEEIQHIYDWIINLVETPTTSHEIRAEAADMLMLTNNSRYMEIARNALEQLRREEDPPIITAPLIPQGIINIPARIASGINIQPHLPQGITPRMIDQQRELLAVFEARKPKIPRTVHEDGQNVHNTEINNSVLEAAANIIKDNKTGSLYEFDRKLIKDLSAFQKGKIDSALHRILTDSTTFKHGTSLFGLFQSLQSFINSSPHKDELNKRLIEELIDMSGQCATGHLSRLVNVVQGFEAAPQQKIKMNIKDEIYARVSHSLTQALQKPENSTASDAIVMGDNQRIVNDFVSAELNKMVPELIKEYKDIAKPEEVRNELLSSARTYTKNDQFIMKNNQIISTAT